MKRVLFMLALTCLTLGSFEQGKVKGKDYIIMKQDGKVYWMRGGETIKIMIDVPLKNGSKVNYKGIVAASDGQSTQLQKGDKVMMDGTIVTARKTKS